jgi:hypothetical protein
MLSQRVFSLKSLFCNVMKKSKEAVKYPPIVPRKSVMNQKIFNPCSSIPQSQIRNQKSQIPRRLCVAFWVHLKPNQTIFLWGGAGPPPPSHSTHLPHLSDLTFNNQSAALSLPPAAKAKTR